jgi:putative transposase
MFQPEDEGSHSPRNRTAVKPPARTPSFVCEVPLRASPAQEHTLLARLEAARQVYNACLGEARKRARLVRESKAFQQARTLAKDDPECKRLFREARQQHAFSDYALQTYAQPLGHSWLGEQLDSPTIQKLASRPACHREPTREWTASAVLLWSASRG